MGWERIKDFIRNEEHNRVLTESEPRKETPLRSLKNEEFLHLRSHYPLATPGVRALFCACAFLVSFWDREANRKLDCFHVATRTLVWNRLGLVSKICQRTDKNRKDCTLTNTTLIGREDA